MSLLSGYKEIEDNLINDNDYQRNLEILKWIYKYPYPVEVISQFYIEKILHGIIAVKDIRISLKDLLVEENKIYVFYINMATMIHPDGIYFTATRLGDKVEQLMLSKKEYITFLKFKKEYESIR